MSDLIYEGKGAVVTGSGRGVGRAIASALAERGARVLVVARTEAEVEESASQIVAAGGQAIAVVADLGRPDDVQRVLDRAFDQLGRVDIMINNAAVVWPVGPSQSIDFAAWQLAQQINVTAVAALNFGVLPQMLEQSWGRIINVSSGVASSPGGMIGANAYATSKAALEGHTLSLAAELEGTGVTVNAYRPGRVDTAMQAWMRDQDPSVIGEVIHDRFVHDFENGELITSETSAAALMPRLASDLNGRVWHAADPL